LELGKLEGVKELFIPAPTGIKPEQIVELSIIPRNGCFYAAYSYKITPPVVTNLDKSKALGVDHGRDNWLTCVSNTGDSFIIDGLKLKSINQWYNKQISKLKEGKPQGFWSNLLARITEKRNRQMRDAVNKASRIVVNRCLEQGIGTIVFGWNVGQKQASGMGKSNQSFVSIPTARLKDRIKQLCDFYGIRFIETEESFTSKASFFDNDPLPKHGEQRVGRVPRLEATANPKGRRVHRGVYRTRAKNWYINADANAAANILRKVSTMLDLDLSGVCRGQLTALARLTFWNGSSQNPLPTVTA
jgi:IS605 OrfB family transposase